MDDTTTRDVPAGLTGSDLPDSLAWLDDPSPAGRPVAPEPGAAPAPPASVPPELAHPALAPLWAAVREALRHPAPTGDRTIELRGLDRAARRAVADLLGVPVRATHRVDLGVLEGIVHHTAGLPLGSVAELAGPLAGDGRRVRARTRTGAVRAGRDWLETHPAVGAQPWAATWLESVRRDVAGSDPGLTEQEVVTALEVLAAVAGRPSHDAGLPSHDAGLPSHDAGPPSTGAAEPSDWSCWRLRREVAEAVAEDEYALDDGSPVATLVLRGLAAASGTPLPADAAGRRRLWTGFGVLPDLVSTTCLAVGLAPADVDGGVRLRHAAAAGTPVHVTPLDLRSSPGPWETAGHEAWPAVLVVDNPSALEAVARRFAGRVAAICTAHLPAPPALDLLARVHAGGTPLTFTVDFDQAGIALGTLLVDRFSATPRRMTADVYGKALRSDLPRLAGRLPAAAWDLDLVAA
ncbi:MAG: TIGR02679 domain-containing protein, partial [Kineosporiaceae bacterium]